MHTRDIGQQYKLFGAEYAGEFASYRIGINIVAGAVLICTDRCDNRDEITVFHHLHDLGVDANNLANLAYVDAASARLGAFEFELSCAY